MKRFPSKVQIQLPVALHRILRDSARRKGVCLSAYLRFLLSKQVAAEAIKANDPLLKLLRNKRGYGPQDGSRQVDWHLYGKC